MSVYEEISALSPWLRYDDGPPHADRNRTVAYVDAGFRNHAGCPAKSNAGATLLRAGCQGNSAGRRQCVYVANSYQTVISRLL